MNYQRNILSVLLLAFSMIAGADNTDARKVAEDMNRRAEAAMKIVSNQAIRDSLAICRAIVTGVECSLKCDEYDRMPNRKGVVKMRFEKANITRLRYLGDKLVTAGMYMYKHSRNYVEALDALKLCIMVKEGNCQSMEVKDYTGVASAHIARINLDKSNYKEADRYADIALRYDESAQKGAEVKAQCMYARMITAQDSAKYLAVITRLYETEPTNETYFAWLMKFYSRPSQRHKLEYFVDKELEHNPDNSIPWILKGEIAMQAQRWDEAIDAYKHSDEIIPGEVPVIYNIGVCLNNKALEMSEDLKKQQGTLSKEDETKIKQVFAEARNYFERVRVKDPHRKKVDWVTPLYMVYTVLGEKIKLEELKPLVTGFKD